MRQNGVGTAEIRLIDCSPDTVLQGLKLAEVYQMSDQLSSGDSGLNDVPHRTAPALVAIRMLLGAESAVGVAMLRPSSMQAVCRLSRKLWSEL